MHDIANFYDDYISKQLKSGINDRIYGLYKRLINLGLTDTSQVFEIGCGIGSLTYLLSRKIRHGNIEAIDISPKSIGYAKKHLSKPNLKFTAGNILEYNPTNAHFDYILLFDVLEHIPLENHELLFKKISDKMLENSRLLINIPNPEYIKFDQKNNPEILQEIDQPISLDHLSRNLSGSSLVLEYFETYSVWVKNDYQFVIVTKISDFKEEKLSDHLTLFEKSVAWLIRKWRKVIYNFPRPEF